MKLNKNVGSVDRIIRAVAALVLAALYFTGAVSGAAGLVLLALAVILAATSAFSFCPLYLPFKFSTHK